MVVPALTCSGRSAVQSCDFCEGDSVANSGTCRPGTRFSLPPVLASTVVCHWQQATCYAG
jgi:hypothetical protein